MPTLIWVPRTPASPVLIPFQPGAAGNALSCSARAVFRTGKHRALKGAFRSEVAHINILLRSEVLHINALFKDGPMSNPNTTIDVTVTVTDQNNFVVSNLTQCTCTITFPDGSTQGPLSSTNLGNGVYSVTYTTKNQGLTRELWNMTDTSGATAQFLNINPVSF